MPASLIIVLRYTTLVKRDYMSFRNTKAQPATSQGSPRLVLRQPSPRTTYPASRRPEERRYTTSIETQTSSAELRHRVRPLRRTPDQQIAGLLSQIVLGNPSTPDRVWYRRMEVNSEENYACPSVSQRSLVLPWNLTVVNTFSHCSQRFLPHPRPPCQ